MPVDDTIRNGDVISIRVPESDHYLIRSPYQRDEGLKVDAGTTQYRIFKINQIGVYGTDPIQNGADITFILTDVSSGNTCLVANFDDIALPLRLTTTTPTTFNIKSLDNSNKYLTNGIAYYIRAESKDWYWSRRDLHFPHGDYDEYYSDMMVTDDPSRRRQVVLVKG